MCTSFVMGTSLGNWARRCACFFRKRARAPSCRPTVQSPAQLTKDWRAKSMAKRLRSLRNVQATQTEPRHNRTSWCITTPHSPCTSMEYHAKNDSVSLNSRFKTQESLKCQNSFRTRKTQDSSLMCVLGLKTRIERSPES